MNSLYRKVHEELPIFEIENNPFKILYTPGYFIKVINTLEIDTSIMLNHPESIENAQLKNAIHKLLGNASLAMLKWESFKNMPFEPECLTIHVGIECNLNCCYCYSKIEKTGNHHLKGFPEKSVIKTLITYLIDEVKDKSDRVTVVYHGAGEPTYHWEQLVDCHKLIESIVKPKNVEVFYYIATNGCLTIPQVDWLSSKINLIGISCDGTEEIHFRQRPVFNNKYLSVPELCKRIADNGGHFELRVTVTRGSMDSQLEIAKYLIENCKPRNIRVEPEYLSSDTPFTSNDADKFYTEFIRAQKYAEQLNINLSYSGVRIEEIHGSYCDVLRKTLRITPDNNLRNCFCYIKSDTGYITGKYLIGSKRIKFNDDLVELKRNALKIPYPCCDCINILHCSRGCPDFCMFEDCKPEHPLLNSFRCRLHQLITVDKIKRLAGSI